MISRRLQVVGNRSYSVCLPKDWVVSNNLSEKDQVFIEKTSSNDLLIKRSSASTKTQKQVSINISDVQNIKEFLVFCYVKNVDVVNISAKKFDYATITSIKKVLSHLEGYDVTHEDEKKISIAFLFKDINVRLQDLLKRIVYLIGLLHTALQNKDMETVDETENEIDRLYHLSTRIMISCTRDTQQLEQNGLLYIEDLFFMTIIFKKLENIADNLYIERENGFSKADDGVVGRLIKVLNELLTNPARASHVKKELESMKDEIHRPTSNETVTEVYTLCKDILENIISLEYSRQFSD